VRGNARVTLPFVYTSAHTTYQIKRVPKSNARQPISGIDMTRYDEYTKLYYFQIDTTRLTCHRIVVHVTFDVHIDVRAIETIPITLTSYQYIYLFNPFNLNSLLFYITFIVLIIEDISEKKRDHLLTCFIQR